VAVHVKLLMNYLL